MLCRIVLEKYVPIIALKNNLHIRGQGTQEPYFDRIGLNQLIELLELQRWQNSIP